MRIANPGFFSQEDSQDEHVSELVQRVASAEAELQALLESQVDTVMDPVSVVPRLLREAQSALLESEAQFHALADTTSAAIFITQAGCIRYVNPAAELVIGCRREELLGRYFWEILSIADQELARVRWGSDEASREISSDLQLNITHPDGSQHWLVVNSRGIPFKGRPATVITAFDISPLVSLEERLLERTRELQAANESLAANLEELHAAEEELRLQNDELTKTNEALAIARRAVEIESRRYHDLFNYAPDGYLVTDLYGEIKEANKAAARMLNIFQGKLLGMQLVRFVDVQDRRSFRTQLNKLKAFLQAPKEIAEHEKDWQYQETETRLIPRDAEPFFAALIGLAVTPKPGEEPVIRWQLHVITQRLKANQALRASQNELRQTSELLERVFASIDTLIAYMDRDFNFLRVNRAYAQSAGFEPEYFIGKNHFGLYPHEENQAIFSQVVETGEPYLVYEKVFVYPDQPERGETYWDWSLQPVKDIDGYIQGVVLSLVDVTDRKRAEDQLRQNAARAETLAGMYRTIVEAGPNEQVIIQNVVREIATSDGAACILRLVSEAGEQLEPRSFHHPDPAASRLLSNLLAFSSQAIDEKAARFVFRSGEALLVSEEVERSAPQPGRADFPSFYTKEGFKSAMTVPLRVKGGILGTISLIRDQAGRSYTQEDQMLLQSLADQASLAIVNARLYRDLEYALQQEQLARSQLILFEKHSAVSRMVASIAHELNNPIQTIKNCLYLTQQESPASSQVHEFLDMAFSEAQRISRLVSQLREIYRPNPQAEMKPLNLVSVVSNVKAVLEPHLQHEGVSWVQDHEQESVIVAGVYDQLMQVFLNISLNAIEAMQPQGGRLRVDIQVSGESNQALVAFEDTGPGIPEQLLENLFEPFFTTKENGTGLGLSICYEIVQAHRGQISVESQPGAGATFIVSLPLASEK